MDSIILSSLNDLEIFAETMLADLASTDSDRATVLALSGDLGAGKTAFVKALAKQLGITEHVTSPTFVIMKSYDSKLKAQSSKSKRKGEKFNRLIHIDAYRLKNGDELTLLGWNDLIADPQNLIALEWPEMVKEVVPEEALRLSFEHVDETTRRVHKIQSTKFKIQKKNFNSKI